MQFSSQAGWTATTEGCPVQESAFAMASAALPPAPFGVPRNLENVDLVGELCGDTAREETTERCGEWAREVGLEGCGVGAREETTERRGDGAREAGFEACGDGA